jgi:hypothetical protein
LLFPDTLSNRQSPVTANGQAIDSVTQSHLSLTCVCDRDLLSISKGTFLVNPGIDRADEFGSSGAQCATINLMHTGAEQNGPHRKTGPYR